MLAPGIRIDDRYEVEGFLGRGGMADVMRAHDVATGETVALKVLRLDDERSRSRFRTELEVLRLLDHPSVVRLRDAGWWEAQPYLTLDLVGGPTLSTLLAEGPLGVDRSVTIAIQLASALAHAHRLGVVHRDVKPSNVLLDEKLQRARLADFGIAHVGDATTTTAGMCVGTACYIAPEQLEGRTGPEGDVYSLGLVLLECLTGVVCFPGTIAESAMARLHRSPAVPTDLPPWLQHTLRSMTERQPDHRPGAAAVAAALQQRSLDPLLPPTAPISLAGWRLGRRARPARHTPARRRDHRRPRVPLGGAVAATTFGLAGLAGGLALLADGELRVAEAPRPAIATRSPASETLPPGAGILAVQPAVGPASGPTAPRSAPDPPGATGAQRPASGTPPGRGSAEAREASNGNGKASGKPRTSDDAAPTKAG